MTKCMVTIVCEIYQDIFGFAAFGVKPVGSQMYCDNSQIVPSQYKCIFEMDQYGIQRGCRDMSHLNGCG